MGLRTQYLETPKQIAAAEAFHANPLLEQQNQKWLAQERAQGYINPEELKSYFASLSPAQIDAVKKMEDSEGAISQYYNAMNRWNKGDYSRGALGQVHDWSSGDNIWKQAAQWMGTVGAGIGMLGGPSIAGLVGKAAGGGTLGAALGGAGQAALTGGDPLKGAALGGLGAAQPFGASHLGQAAQGAAEAMIQGGDPLRGAVAGGAGSYLNQSKGGKNMGVASGLGSKLGGGGTSASSGGGGIDWKNTLINTGIGYAVGGKSGAITGAVTSILPQLPGDIGQFFGSDIGQNIVSIFQGLGGDVGKMGVILENLGFSGKSKDIIEQMLGFFALAAISDKFAEDAINRARQLEDEELLTIRQMNQHAQELYPTPESEETEYGVKADQIANAYRQAAENMTKSLASRGALRSGMQAGQVGRLAAEEATAKLGARRDIALERPAKILAGIQGQSTALGPLGRMGEQARDVAEKTRMAPIEFAKALYLKAANANDPLAAYYKSEADKIMAQQADEEYQKQASQYDVPTTYDDTVFGPPKPEEANPVSLPEVKFTYDEPKPAWTEPDVGSINYSEVFNLDRPSSLVQPKKKKNWNDLNKY